MEIQARDTLKELHVTTVRSIRQPVASLSGGQRQSVAVAKAVMSQAKLVIMDEPTAALGVAQTGMVLSLIKTLSGARRRGDGRSRTTWSTCSRSPTGSPCCTWGGWWPAGRHRSSIARAWSST